MNISPLRIEHFLWFMQGASRPVMAQASDGHHYIVKLTGDDTDTYLNFNESAGTELFSACGLSVAPWACLELTRDMIEQTRKRWPDVVENHPNLKPGLYCGTRYLGTAGTRVFEALPAEDLRRVTNRTSFWLAWLLDVCAEQSQNRQAVFVENAEKKITAYFVDHSGLFGGCGLNQRRDLDGSRNKDEQIYVHLRPSEIEAIPQVLYKANWEQLRKRIDALPEAWRSPASLSAFEDCLSRMSDLVFLEDTMQAIDRAHRFCPRILFGGRRLPAHTPLPQAG